MGKQVRLSQVKLLFGPGSTTAGIYLGNSGPSTSTSSSALSSFKLVSPQAAGSGSHTFNVSSADANVTGQYVLIWLTSLPKMVNPPAAAVSAGQGTADLPGSRLRRRDTRDRGLRGGLAAGGSGLPWPRTVAWAHPDPPASAPARTAR